MKTSSDKYSQLFILLTETINNFIKEVDKHNLSDTATEEWSVKDELSHIAFWHDYYAKNYCALAAGTRPFLFISKGGSTRNQVGVDKLKHKSKKYLVTLLNKAQTSLYDSIVVKMVPKMTYVVGKDYTTESFLEMIIGHIQRHTIQVRRAKKINK
ncbi:MAG: hypothetical protein V1917_01300 [Candidatus Gottesmanbacteria bacterium]